MILIMRREYKLYYIIRVHVSWSIGELHKMKEFGVRRLHRNKTVQDTKCL